MEITLCAKCLSYIDGKCNDCFEPGVKYACVNFLEKKDADRQPDNSDPTN